MPPAKTPLVLAHTLCFVCTCTCVRPWQPVQDSRSLMQHLTATRTALKQADVRIAILEERILALQQVSGCRCGINCVLRLWSLELDCLLGF